MKTSPVPHSPLSRSVHTVLLFRWIAFLATFATACSSSTQQVSVSPTPSTRELPARVAALPVTRAAGAAFGPSNPFERAAFYRDPHYAAKVDSSIASAPELATQLEQVKAQPTGLWLDRIGALTHVPAWLEDAREQTRTAGQPVVPVFVVYDLPNRDCAAKASNGELKIEEDGERRYREEYIDVIARLFAEHPEQRIVAVIEPDSLPNLISNLGVEKCHVSHDVYIHSVAYAIAKLSLPNVALYVDAAHAGWLGWEANQRRMAQLMKLVLDLAGGTDRIRGFATNVSNYNGLSGDWGKRLESSNPSPNELSYVEAFQRTLESEGISGKSFLVDTSRNGQVEIRTRWGNWCNIEGAGLGERPRVSPVAGVDAYFWIKPPGDSDGIADPSAVRFDENCASVDATPGAPEAGQWFHPYFLDLVRNATPPL